jgi:hypothetical protein
MRPLETMNEKKKLLAEAVAGNWVLYFEHDPKVECCTLQQTEKGIRVKNTFALKDMEGWV